MKKPICASLWKGRECANPTTCDRTHLPICSSEECKPKRKDDCTKWHYKTKVNKHDKSENRAGRKYHPGSSSTHKGPAEANKTRKSYVTTQLNATKMLRERVLLLEKEKRERQQKFKMDQEVQRRLKAELKRQEQSQPTWAQVATASVPSSRQTVAPLATSIAPNLGVSPVIAPGTTPDMAKVMAKVAEMAQQFALLAASLSTC